MVNDNWHLSKTVTVGNMMTMFLAIMAMVGSYYTLDKRLAMLEVTAADQERHIEQINNRIVDRLDRIEGLIMQVHFNKKEQ